MSSVLERRECLGGYVKSRASVAVFQVPGCRRVPARIVLPSRQRQDLVTLATQVIGKLSRLSVSGRQTRSKQWACERRLAMLLHPPVVSPASAWNPPITPIYSLEKDRCDIERATMQIYLLAVAAPPSAGSGHAPPVPEPDGAASTRVSSSCCTYQSCIHTLPLPP
jgi:hypothetical protein